MVLSINSENGHQTTSSQRQFIQRRKKWTLDQVEHLPPSTATGTPMWRSGASLVKIMNNVGRCSRI